MKGNFNIKTRLEVHVIFLCHRHQRHYEKMQGAKNKSKDKNIKIATELHLFPVNLV